MNRIFKNVLELGLAHDHIDEAGDAVARFLGLDLELKDGDEEGIYYYYYSGELRLGATAIAVRQNLVNGRWQFDLRPELRILVSYSVVSPHVFDLGAWMTRFETGCEYAPVPFRAVIRPATLTPKGYEIEWGYSVHYTNSGAPKPGTPPLDCKLAFDLSLDLDDATEAVTKGLKGTLEDQPDDPRTVTSCFGRLTLSPRGPGTRLEAILTTSDLLLPGRLEHTLAEIDPEVTPRFHDISGELREGRVEHLCFGEDEVS